jgi:hypothetical protein
LQIISIAFNNNFPFFFLCFSTLTSDDILIKTYASHP